MADEVTGITIWRSEVVGPAAVLNGSARLQYYDAIFAYVFEGVEPEFTGRQADVLKAFWDTTKHQLDLSMTKRRAGRAGGLQKASNAQAKAKQNASKALPKDKDKDKDKDNITPLTPLAKGGPGEGAAEEVEDDYFGVGPGIRVDHPGDDR